MANKCAQSLIENKNCSIRAEEKTGKRTIMEAIHLIMIVNHGISVLPESSIPCSIYVTALNRKDTKDQFREQEEEYGIRSICASKKDEILAEIIKVLNDETNDGIFYIHLDECDYGTGSSQSLSKIYNSEELNLNKHKDRIKYVTYSATPEELECSEQDEKEWDFHTFIPNKSYVGADYYLRNKLLYDPTTFFSGDFSEQAQQLIHDVNENCSSASNEVKQRNVIVVRDTTPNGLDNIRKQKPTLMVKYNCVIHIFDKNDGFEWTNPDSWCELGRTELLDGNRCHQGYQFISTLIFIAQTCTRSTEICPLGHRKIYAWHDARKLSEKKAYNTLSQAIGRAKHYSQVGYSENKIKLYVDKDVLNITVGIPTKTNYLNVGQRIDTTGIKQRKIIFNGYKDVYGNSDSVPEEEWVKDNADPNGSVETKFEKDENGKWCHYDRMRVWGDPPPGSTNHEQIKNVLQYENETSFRYIIRKAKYEINKKYDEENKKTEFSYKTGNKSMYVATE